MTYIIEARPNKVTKYKALIYRAYPPPRISDYGIVKLYKGGK